MTLRLIDGEYANKSYSSNLVTIGFKQVSNHKFSEGVFWFFGEGYFKNTPTTPISVAWF